MTSSKISQVHINSVVQTW